MRTSHTARHSAPRSLRNVARLRRASLKRCGGELQTQVEEVMNQPTDICACGHPRSAHRLNEVQHFTDGSVRHRLCAETIYNGWTGRARWCMCDRFMQPLDDSATPAGASCSYCRHQRALHAADGCHATVDGPAWRPGECRCNCDQYPGQPTFRRWKLRRATRPHGRCADAGYCVEHDADSGVPPCR